MEQYAVTPWGVVRAAECGACNEFVRAKEPVIPLEIWYNPIHHDGPVWKHERGACPGDLFEGVVF